MNNISNEKDYLLSLGVFKFWIYKNSTMFNIQELSITLLDHRSSFNGVMNKTGLTNVRTSIHVSKLINADTVCWKSRNPREATESLHLVQPGTKLDERNSCTDLGFFVTRGFIRRYFYTYIYIFRWVSNSASIAWWSCWHRSPGSSSSECGYFTVSVAFLAMARSPWGRMVVFRGAIGQPPRHPSNPVANDAGRPDVPLSSPFFLYPGAIVQCHGTGERSGPAVMSSQHNTDNESDLYVPYFYLFIKNPLGALAFARLPCAPKLSSSYFFDLFLCILSFLFL